MQTRIDLHKRIKELYSRYKVPYSTRKNSGAYEVQPLVLMAKYAGGIHYITDYDLFSDIKQTERNYALLTEQKPVSVDMKTGDFFAVLGANLSYYDLGKVDLDHYKAVILACLHDRHTLIYYIQDLTASYVELKMIEGILSGAITSKRQKEVLKLTLVGLLDVPAPSDSATLRRFMHNDHLDYDKALFASRLTVAA